MMNKIPVRVAGSLLASAALVLGSQTAAGADSSGYPSGGTPGRGGPPVISVDVTTEGGFSLPSSVHAGVVTFRMTSPENAFHAIQGFSLNPGVTLDQALADINEALSGDPARVAAGMQAIMRDITEIGGVVTSPHAAQEVTIPMEAGTYYFLDINDVNNPPLTPRVHTLEAVGHFRWSKLPRYTSVIEATMIDDQPRFIAPSQMAHDETFLGIVTGDELHESVFRPVRDGVTDDYISLFYEAVKNGTTRPPSPWTGIQAGLQALSPGRWAIMHIDLPPGPYALICYVPSDETAVPHGWDGMHQIVTLT
jgi:hypothetical protein